MDTLREKRVSQQAYIHRVMKSQRGGPGVADVGRFVKAGSGLGADFVRHALTLIGVGGLVALAAGSTTECQMYQTVLNWVTSFFV